jgi:hypothetical protein
MEPDCPRRTWTETSEHIRPRASLTERARREAYRRVGQDGETAARVAGQYGCVGCPPATTPGASRSE